MLKWLATGIVLIGAPALAGDKTYSHKANADPAAAEAELNVCGEAALAAMKNPSAPNPYNPVTQSTAAGQAGAALAQGFARGIEQGRAYNITYLNCVKSKGFTFRRLPAADWKLMKKLPEAERKARIRLLMTAAVPEHPEMPDDELD